MRSIRLRRPTISPACGPPRSLSPENVTTSMPASIASRAVGSCGRPQVSRSTSVPLPRSSISGRPFSRASGTSSAADTDLVKPVHRVVRGMDLHDRRGVGADRGGIVLEMGAVGGADLDQPAAGAGHDVGDAEGAADLDELAARDDDLAAGGQRRQHQQHGGGVVVDRGRGLGAGQAMQPGRDVIVALAAAAAREIVFQRGRRAHGRDRGLDRLLGQKRAAEIGVQHGAGEIEDAPLRGLHQAGQPPLAPARAGGLVGHLLSCRAWPRPRRAGPRSPAAGRRARSAAPARASWPYGRWRADAAMGWRRQGRHATRVVSPRDVFAGRTARPGQLGLIGRRRQRLCGPGPARPTTTGRSSAPSWSTKGQPCP